MGSQIRDNARAIAPEGEKLLDVGGGGGGGHLRELDRRSVHPYYRPAVGGLEIQDPRRRGLVEEIVKETLA